MIVRTCSYLKARAGAFGARATLCASALAWIALAPGAAWGQWSGGPTGTVYYNGGWVGIGTSSPQAPLHVNGLGAVASSGWNIDTMARFSDGGINSNSAILFDTGATGLTGLRGFEIGKGSQNFSISRFDSAGSVVPVTDLSILSNGNVGIGTANPQYLLSVNGTMGTREVIVTNTGWSDYVFQPDYRLQPLSEVKAYIQLHHHLPEIPSEAEVKEKGVSVGEMQSKLLAKIEELTLHMISVEEKNKELQEKIDRMGAAGVK